MLLNIARPKSEGGGACGVGGGPAACVHERMSVCNRSQGIEPYLRLISCSCTGSLRQIAHDMIFCRSLTVYMGSTYRHRDERLWSYRGNVPGLCVSRTTGICFSLHFHLSTRNLSILFCLGMRICFIISTTSLNSESPPSVFRVLRPSLSRSQPASTTGRHWLSLSDLCQLSAKLANAYEHSYLQGGSLLSHFCFASTNNFSFLILRIECGL